MQCLMVLMVLMVPMVFLHTLEDSLCPEMVLTERTEWMARAVVAEAAAVRTVVHFSVRMVQARVAEAEAKEAKVELEPQLELAVADLLPFT
jgi:hypothetical protein